MKIHGKILYCSTVRFEMEIPHQGKTVERSEVGIMTDSE
jgi:hypothetical protein